MPEVIATTLVSFALSSFLTGLYLPIQALQIHNTFLSQGLTFFLLGYLRLGVLIGFFPRHILVGYVTWSPDGERRLVDVEILLCRCIGGVGVFLVLTG